MIHVADARNNLSWARSPDGRRDRGSIKLLPVEDADDTEKFRVRPPTMLRRWNSSLAPPA
jgi:hypothetical protein